MHVILYPDPPILEYFPSFLSSLPRFQLLAVLHKVFLSLSLSLEHLAPLYTPPVLSTALLARAEGAALNALAESNHLLVGEVGPVLEEADGATERRESITRLKGDIAQSLVDERIIRAKAE